MKISTSKPSGALEKFLREKPRAVVLAFPEEPFPVEPVPALSQGELTPQPELEICSVVAAVVEAVSPPEVPPAPEQPAAPPRAPRLQDLLDSNDWIRKLCRELIETEKKLLEHGVDRRASHKTSSQDPLKAMWARMRQNGNREKFLAQIEKESKRCAEDRKQAEISHERLLTLKQTFLNAIRHIQEPYRSTVFRYFCEGLSVAELVGKQSVSGWIVRERIIAGLDLLDRNLEEKLGKERIRSYVQLSNVAEN